MIGIVSDNPMDYVRVALALETLAYHNKAYLDRNINDNCTLSKEIQCLLSTSIWLTERQQKRSIRLPADTKQEAL